MNNNTKGVDEINISLNESIKKRENSYGIFIIKLKKNLVY